MKQLVILSFFLSFPLFGFGPAEKDQIIITTGLTSVYEIQSQGNFIETVVPHKMIGQIIDTAEPLPHQNNLKKWILVKILYENSSGPQFLHQSVWTPIFKEDSKFLNPARFDDMMSMLTSLKDKLNILEHRMNFVRNWILDGLTDADLDLLRRVIAEEDYSEASEIRNKVFNRLFLLPQSERDFAAMLFVSFGEARGGSSRSIEEISANTLVRAEMLAVLKIVENRLKEARVQMPESQHELLNIVCARKQFSCMNANDPNWIKWVLGPALEVSDKSQIGFSLKFEFTQTLMAYLDFCCEKPVFSPALENPKTLHYCTSAIADETGWENDNPKARKIPNCEAWIELPTLCSSENKKTFIEHHVFFENVRIGKNHLSVEKP